MVDHSLTNLIQWSTSTYSIHEFLDIYEARFPILALVKSVGVPPKTAHNLTTTEMIFVGQVLKVESATEGQKRLIVEVVPQRLSLNIPLDCPAKFDIPHLKKKKVKLDKILSSSKYSLPLVAETSSKYSAYFEKAGAKATGDARKRTVKMVFKKLKERERFLKTNFIHEGSESPLVTFISADLPIEVAVVESYIGPGTEDRLRNKYQLTHASPAKVKVNGKKKKRSPDGQLVIGAGLYIMIETSANNNYIISHEDGSPQSSRGDAAAAAAAAEDDEYMEDDVDGIELDDAAAQDTALNSERNLRVNTTAADAATAEQEEEEEEEERETEDDKEEEGEDNRQRNGDLSPSVPEVSNGVGLPRVAGGEDAVEVAADRRNEEASTEKEVDVKVKQKPVLPQRMDSKQSSSSSVQSYPGQSTVEETNQISRSAALNRQLAKEPGVRVDGQGQVESSKTGLERHNIYDEIRRRQSEPLTIDRGSKTNFFANLSLESEDSDAGESLNSIDRIDDDVEMQIKRIAQVAPVSQDLKQPTPMPRQSLRSKRSLAQQLITEMNLGSTGVFCVELLPLGQLDGDHQKLHNGGPPRNKTFVSDDEDETSNEILFPEGNKFRLNSRSPPTQRRNFRTKSVSSNDSFSVSQQKNDSGKAQQLENVFFFGESFVSPDTKMRHTVGMSNVRNTKGTFITTTTDISEVFRTSTERTEQTMIQPWSKASLSQAHSLDRRQTHQAKDVRHGSQNTDDASTQTMSMSPSYPSVDRRTLEEDSSPSRPVDRSQSKTVVQVSGGRHQQLPSANSDYMNDEIHGRKVRRNDSMIQRIILNDSEQATCKITSFTSTPSSDRSTDANVSCRVPSFRAEHEAAHLPPSISTLPRKWTSSTPVQTPLTSNAHRHVVTVELPPYFDSSSHGTSFNPDSTARNQMVNATPSAGRFVSDVDHWNSSKSTPDLVIAKPRGSSRFQAVAHTASEPLRSDASMPRGIPETGYTIRINTHEDRQDMSIDRRTRARQNKRQDDSDHQTRGRAEMEAEDNNTRMASITKENVVVVTTRKEEGDYKLRKTIGRSRTTVSDAPRNLNQRGALRPTVEKFLDEVEVHHRSGNTSRRPMEHLHCTTRTRSLDSPTYYQRTEELDLQSSERKEDLPSEQVVKPFGLVVTTNERVLQSRENSHVKPDQNRHFTSNGKATDVLKYRSSNRITSAHSPNNNNLSPPLQARHTQKSKRTPEDFDHFDSNLIQPPNHQQRRSKYRADETKNRGIEQFQPHLRVRTTENVNRPSYDVRTPEEFHRSTMIARATIPAQNSKRGTLEKQNSNVTTHDLYQANHRMENVIHQTKYNRTDMKQSRNIQAPENDFALNGNSRVVSVRNDNISKRTTNVMEKRGVQRKPHNHQPSHNRRDNNTKAAAAAASTSVYNENKHENHSYSTMNVNQRQPTNSTTLYASSATPVATTKEKSSPYLIVSTHVSANGSTAEPPPPQLPLSQSASNGINQAGLHQTKKSKRRRNKEIAADQELIYPIDLTVRESIRSLDRFLKEQDPDAQSIASSQFTEHHELIVHHDITGTTNF